MFCGLLQALPIVAGQQPDTHLFKLQKYRVQDTKLKVTVVRPAYPSLTSSLVRRRCIISARVQIKRARDEHPFPQHVR